MYNYINILPYDGIECLYNNSLTYSTVFSLWLATNILVGDFLTFNINYSKFLSIIVVVAS